MGGGFIGSVDFGTGVWVSSGMDGAVVEYDADCVPSLDRSYFLGGGGDQIIAGLATSGSDVIVAGFGGEVVVEDEPHLGLGPSDLFVVRYPPEGAPVVSLLGGSAGDWGWDVVALDAPSDVLVGGTVQSVDMDFAGARVDLLGPMDGVVARINASGSGVSLLQIGGGGISDVGRLGFSPATGIAAASGQIRGTSFFPEFERDAEAVSAFVYMFRP